MRPIPTSRLVGWLVLALVLLAAVAHGQTPTPVLAAGKSWPIPLADGTVGTGVILPGTGGQAVLLVAVPGQPPTLTYYTLVVASSPIPSPGPAPGPVPPPSPPGPAPGPIPPPGPAPLTGTALLAYQWATESVAAGPERQADAVKLAGSFEGIAAQIAAGVLPDATAIVAATQAANRAALGTRRDAWVAWAAKLNEHLKAESAAGRLKNPDEHRVAWLEIAAGLRRVTP